MPGLFRVAAFCLLTAASVLPAAAGTGDFLDQPALVFTGTLATYADVLNGARSLSGKEVRASDLLQKWMALTPSLPFRTSYENSATHAATVRLSLDALVQWSRLKWTYEAKREVIQLDFSWRRSDPRPARGVDARSLEKCPRAGQGGGG